MNYREYNKRKEYYKLIDDFYKYYNLVKTQLIKYGCKTDHIEDLKVVMLDILIYNLKTAVPITYLLESTNDDTYIKEIIDNYKLDYDYLFKRENQI